MLSTFARTADNNALNHPYFPTWTLLSIRFVYAWGTPRWRIVTVAKLLVTWVKPSNCFGSTVIHSQGRDSEPIRFYNFNIYQYTPNNRDSLAPLYGRASDKNLSKAYIFWRRKSKCHLRSNKRKFAPKIMQIRIRAGGASGLLEFSSLVSLSFYESRIRIVASLKLV